MKKVKHLKSCTPLENQKYPTGEYTTKTLCSCVYNRNRAYFDRLYREYEVYRDQLEDSRATLFCILSTKCDCKPNVALYITRQYHAPYRGTLLFTGANGTVGSGVFFGNEGGAKGNSKNAAMLSSKTLYVVLFVLLLVCLKHYLITAALTGGGE